MSNAGEALKEIYRQSEFKIYYCHRDEFLTRKQAPVVWREFLIDGKQVLKDTPIVNTQNFYPISPKSYQSNCTINLRNWAVRSSSSNVAGENNYVLWSVLIRKYGLVFDGKKFVSGALKRGTYKTYRFDDLCFQVRAVTANREDAIFTGFPYLKGNETLDTLPIIIKSTVEEAVKYPCDDLKNEYNGWYSNLTFGQASDVLKTDYMELTGDTDDIILEDEYGRTDTFYALNSNVVGLGQTDNYLWHSTANRATLIRKSDRQTENINIDNVIVRYIYEYNNKIYAVLQTGNDGHGIWCNTYIRCWTDHKDRQLTSYDTYLGRAQNSIAFRDDIRSDEVYWRDVHNETALIQLATLTVDFVSDNLTNASNIPYYKSSGSSTYSGKIGAVQIASSEGNHNDSAGSYFTSYCPQYFANKQDITGVTEYLYKDDGILYRKEVLPSSASYVPQQYDAVDYTYSFFANVIADGSGSTRINDTERQRANVSGRSDFIFVNNKLYCVLAPTTAPNSTSASSPYTGYTKNWNNYGMSPVYEIDPSTYARTLIASQLNHKIVDWIADDYDSTIVVMSLYNVLKDEYSVKQLNLSTGTVSDYRSTAIDSSGGITFNGHFYNLYINSLGGVRNLFLNYDYEKVYHLDSTATLNDYDYDSVVSTAGGFEYDSGSFRVYGKKNSTKELVYFDYDDTGTLTEIDNIILTNTERMLHAERDSATNDSVLVTDNYIIDRYENVRIQLLDLSSFQNRLQAFLELVAFSNKIMATTPQGDIFFKNLNGVEAGTVSIDDDDIVSASIIHSDKSDLKKYLTISSNYINGDDIYNITVREAKQYDTIKDTDIDFYVLPNIVDTSFSMQVEILGSASFKYKIIATDQKIPYGWRTVIVSNWSDIEFTVTGALALNLSFAFTPDKGDKYDFTCNNKRLDRTSNTNRTEINPTVRIDSAVNINNKFIYASIENSFANQIKDYYTGQKLEYEIVLNYPLTLERRYNFWITYNTTYKLTLSYSPFDIYDEEFYVTGYKVNFSNNTTTLRLLEV